MFADVRYLQSFFGSCINRHHRCILKKSYLSKLIIRFYATLTIIVNFMYNMVIWCQRVMHSLLNIIKIYLKFEIVPTLPNFHVQTCSGLINRSNRPNFCSCEKKAWKSTACMGFKPLTSAILVQCSTNNIAQANMLIGSRSGQWYSGIFLLVCLSFLRRNLFFTI